MLTSPRTHIKRRQSNGSLSGSKGAVSGAGTVGYSSRSGGGMIKPSQNSIYLRSNQYTDRKKFCNLFYDKK